MRKIIQLVQHE